MRTIVAVLALVCVSGDQRDRDEDVQESEGEDQNDGELCSRIHLHSPDEKYG